MSVAIIERNSLTPYLRILPVLLLPAPLTVVAGRTVFTEPSLRHVIWQLMLHDAENLC